MLKTRHIMALGGVSALLFAFAPAAMATPSPTGTATVDGSVGAGSLSQTVGTLADPAWSVQLGGLAGGGGNQTATYVQTINPSNDLGSGQDWQDTVTSTNYVGISDAALAHTFSFGASGDSSITPAATDEISTLGSASITPVTSARGNDSFVGTAAEAGVVIPQAASAPQAVPFLTADAGQGMGDFTLSPTVSVVVPADAYAGTYESTVTYTVQIGP